MSALTVKCSEHPKYRGAKKPSRRYSRREVGRARQSWRGGMVHTERSTKKTYLDPCQTCQFLFELVNENGAMVFSDGSQLVRGAA